MILSASTYGLSRMEPAAPTLDQTTGVINTVERCPMLSQVRGAGTLVPEEIRWIASMTQGRVERILILTGTPVTPDTVLLELSNPELEASVPDARSELEAAEADLTNLGIQLESQRLTQEASAAAVAAEHKQAKLQAEADAALAREGPIAELTLKFSQVRVSQMEALGVKGGRRVSCSGCRSRWASRTSLQKGECILGVLLRDQAHADLSLGPERGDGLDAGAGVTVDDAVHLKRFRFMP